MDRLYSTAEAGDILGVTAISVWRWIKAGRIPAINLTEGDSKPKYRIRAEDLEKFLGDNALDLSA